MNIDEAEIEAVARAICKKLRKDPDDKICMQVPFYSWSPYGQYYFVPEESIVSPLWKLYVEVAVVAIEMGAKSQ